MPKKTNKQPNTDLAHDERGSVTVSVPHPHLPHIRLHLPAPLINLFAWSKSLTAEQYIVSLAILSQLFLVAYWANFLLPKSANYSFSGATCSNNLLVLPRLHRTNVASNYQLVAGGGFKVAGYPISATSTCLVPSAAPSAGTQTVKLSLAFLPFLSQQISVVTPALPSVTDVETVAKMPTNVPATFTLDQADQTFTYKLLANDKSSDCVLSDKELSCSTEELSLKQSTKYDFRLERHFAGAPVETLFERSIATINAITVSKSSVKEGQIIYDKTKSITTTFSKVLESYDQVKLTNLATNETIPVTTKIEGKSLTVTATDDLPRQTNFALSIAQVVAPDRSSLASSYTLKFSTSGGPKVLSASVGSYGVYTSSNITLSFDSPIASSQNVAKYITLTTDSQTVTANVYASGSTITINPAANLPACTVFTVRVIDGLASTYGITGGSAWSMNSRTICRTESVIGTSVLGRSIVAYHFGNGPSKIILFGNMHGNEASGKYTLDSLVDELEAKFSQIPANRTVIVIPTINPDGLVAGNRYNSRQVDLNRNFPDVDWQADVKVAGGEILKNNGGTAPLSEPEATALASFIQSQNPRLIISYHAVGSFIIANEAGDSTALAGTYSSLSNYWVASPSQVGDLLDYQITGTLEGWTANILGVPTLVIEQSTFYGNELYSQRGAIWAMINLP